MKITYDVQKLEPGNRVELFELDATALGGDLLRFHGYLQVGPITWNGNAYSAWPIAALGFEQTTDQQPQPQLTVGNLDASISALCAAFDDLVGAVLTRRVTLARYLDGQPEADPTQEAVPQTWYIERKAAEDNEQVEFELSSPMDFGGQQLPARQIIANQCTWGYRSTECGYTGGPVATIQDVPTTDPALDRCSRRLSGCKLRWGATAELPAGSFPAASLTSS